MIVWIGIAGFLFYFLYDINSVLWKNKVMHSFFAVGCCCIAAATAAAFWQGFISRAEKDGEQWLFLVLAVFFLALLIYTLFFALPFEETYQEQNTPQRVYDRGMYALCRHPGVLWFFLFYLFLGLACRPSDLLRQGMVYTACNLAYIIFQDIWTFPKIFDTYGAYKKTAPFLIPNAKSIRRAMRTRKSIGRKSRDLK